MSYKKNKMLRDFLLIAALLIGLGLVIALFSGILKTKPDAVAAQREITVTVEDIPYELLENVKIGDRVLDRTHRSILGRILSLRVEPHTYERAIDGESVIVNKDGYCDAYFSIRLDNENPRTPIGSYYIGEGIAISTPSFAADGRVFSIQAVTDERGE